MTVKIKKRLTDYLTTDYGVKSGADLLYRIGDDLRKDSEVERILKGNPGVQAGLERIANEEFDTRGKSYFKKPILSKLARYGGLGAQLMGGITATGALLTLAAGGPLSAAAGVGYGLAWILGGGLANLGADLYDSKRARAALDGETDETDGVLNYIKKSAKGAWQTVTSPFKKGTRKALAEGLATNALAYQAGNLTALASQYLAPAIGGAVPYAQGAGMLASVAAHYRGQKKFDKEVLGYMRDRIKARLLEQYAGKRAEPVRSMEDRIDELPPEELGRAYSGSNAGYDPRRAFNPIVHIPEEQVVGIPEVPGPHRPGQPGILPYLGYLEPKTRARSNAAEKSKALQDKAVSV